MTDKEIIQALRICSRRTDAQTCTECPLFDSEDCMGDMMVGAADLIERQPAADVAEVVRCKNCIYRIEGRCFSRTSFLNSPAVEPDNFCSWGATE